MAVNRREFLISVAGSVVGRVFLPADFRSVGRLKKGELPSIKLLVPPTKTDLGDGTFLLVYTEVRKNGTESMVWHPETAEELADATAFYEAAINQDGVPGIEQPPQTVAGKAAKWLRDLLTPDPAKRTEEEKALLRDVVDSPEDDAPLLRYADWLEQQGSPQGEFIRVDCQLEHMAEDDPTRPPLDARWSELYEAHAEAIVSPLKKVRLMPVLAGQNYPALSLKRGVLGRVYVEKPRVFPKRMAELFALAPLIDELILDFDGMPLVEIVACPEMAQVRSLEIRGSFRGDTEEAVKALAQSLTTAGLRELTLSHHEIGPEGALQLAKAAFRPKLRRLVLTGERIGTEGLSAILAADDFECLRALDLSDNDLDGDAVEKLARCRSLRTLEELNLHDNRDAAYGLPALAEATFAESLRVLDVSKMDPHPEDVIAFMRGRFAHLESLDISSSQIDRSGFDRLADTDWIQGLRELSLHYNNLDASSAERLAAIPFTRLAKMTLYNNALGDAGMEALAASAHFAALEELDLRTCSIGVRGAQALAKSRAFPKLKRLLLSDNDIGFGGAAALAKAKNFALESLWVETASVGVKGKKLLQERYGDKMEFCGPDPDDESTGESMAGFAEF